MSTLGGRPRQYDTHLSWARHASAWDPGPSGGKSVGSAALSRLSTLLASPQPGGSRLPLTTTLPVGGKRKPALAGRLRLNSDL